MQHKREVQDCERDLEDVERRIKQFEDTRTRKERALQNGNGQLFQAYKFVQSNLGRFRQNVYGPIMLEIDVRGDQHDAVCLDMFAG